jgi:hypothetical protein
VRLADLKKISTLQQLYAASIDRRAVVVPGMQGWDKRMPAAFVIGMPGATILRMFKSGMYLYEKKGTVDADS